ncbi:glutamyl-tRNA synthetase [Leuconostoc kimchii IMSNU 11154]|uniref:Glutamyl-tRNA synthetase n=1 Tax=Leuconostoc kimchii (strain IMSNU 11154 / KCTC 2386 / IH25) TaxID=762051 RepID=D5T2B7_LEUKI|nr:hypothetical protein [Leuconostoc kimchii]ADG40416.1 glutamyl-tRNA synthetase [Leuconostoc kimchii IMSNU 11154]
MTTWQSFKGNIKSISEDEMSVIDKRSESTPSLTTLNRYANGLGLEVKMQVVGLHH